MCQLLTVMDPKIVQVALSGLENILKAGERHNINPNPFAVFIEECYGKNFIFNWFVDKIFTIPFKYCLGLDKIEFLQSHENTDIYHKAFDMIDKYFTAGKEDSRVAPEKNDKEYSFDPKENDFQWNPDNF